MAPAVLTMDDWHSIHLHAGVPLIKKPPAVTDVDAIGTDESHGIHRVTAGNFFPIGSRDSDGHCESSLLWWVHHTNLLGCLSMVMVRLVTATVPRAG